VKERRKGALGRATNLAEGVAAAVRRRAREREPRVLLYESLGFPRLVQPGSREWDRLLDICERMVEIEGAPPGEEGAGGEPRADEAEPDQGAEPADSSDAGPVL
jgi:hypothetical protein